MTIRDVDVLVVGSGFGGSVAALRFAEAGREVLVVERGARVSREALQVDFDFLWRPERAAFGMHDLRARGATIVPWVGAAVGGGSHVYAGTLKRRDMWDGFPRAVRESPMGDFYARAEAVMRPERYPDRAPYSDARATQLLFHAGRTLAAAEPDLVEDHGPINLAISFAPTPAQVGQEFVNAHGAKQRYFDPSEQSILGGDIDAKNTLDRNYLYLAEQRGATVQALTEVKRIERDADGRYRAHCFVYDPDPGAARWWRRWSPWRSAPRGRELTLVARHLVLAAGSIGSTELLLRARDTHRTLPDLNRHVGTRYTTNGDCISLIVPFRGLWLAWGALVAIVAALALGQWIVVAAGLVAYYVALLISQTPYDADVGTTNSDNVRFKARDGTTQGAYIESGRYPTPGKFSLAVLISIATGRFRPGLYGAMRRATRWLRWVVPPFGALARTYPIPLLTMGRDDAYGTFRLDAKERAVIDFELEKNTAFYAWAEDLGRKVARAAGARFVPNVLFKVLKKLEIPHNQGGVPMGDSPDDGAVDHAGRVYGHRNLMVLDGSIIPVSLGPNPAHTILALSERAMEVIVAQLNATGTINPDEGAAP